MTVQPVVPADKGNEAYSAVHLVGHMYISSLVVSLTNIQKLTGGDEYNVGDITLSSAYRYHLADTLALQVLAFAALQNVTVDDGVLTGVVVPSACPPPCRGISAIIVPTGPPNRIPPRRTTARGTIAPSIRSHEFSSNRIYFYRSRSAPFVHVPSTSTDYQYDAVHVNKSLVFGNTVLMLFDYLGYTTDTDTDNTTTSGPASPSTPATSGSAPPSPLAIPLQAAIIGGIVGGVPALALVIALSMCYRRYKKRQSTRLPYARERAVRTSRASGVAAAKHSDFRRSAKGRGVLNSVNCKPKPKTRFGIGAGDYWSRQPNGGRGSHRQYQAAWSLFGERWLMVESPACELREERENLLYSFETEVRITTSKYLPRPLVLFPGEATGMASFMLAAGMATMRRNMASNLAYGIILFDSTNLQCPSRELTRPCHRHAPTEIRSLTFDMILGRLVAKWDRKDTSYTFVTTHGGLQHTLSVDHLPTKFETTNKTKWTLQLTWAEISEGKEG
ncbi:hypothetical protein EV363DRAFT_1528900 [Boletus edulis]|nr:hypothetical protein EV363DRAFT_1528900 [Boletus edulis]